jgi:hypothetical protein
MPTPVVAVCLIGVVMSMVALAIIPVMLLSSVMGMPAILRHIAPDTVVPAAPEQPDL